MQTTFVRREEHETMTRYVDWLNTEDTDKQTGRQADRQTTTSVNNFSTARAGADEGTAWVEPGTLISMDLNMCVLFLTCGGFCTPTLFFNRHTSYTIIHHIPSWTLNMKLSYDNVLIRAVSIASFYGSNKKYGRPEGWTYRAARDHSLLFKLFSYRGQISDDKMNTFIFENRK